MSKGKRSGGKHGRKSGERRSGVRRSRSDAGPAATASGEPPRRTEPGPRRPAGQRLWDMPYSAAAPRMINPAIGLHNLVARAGHNAGYDIDLTLLDAPDHRMIRSGVVLAHRVLDERGEWYLGAPDWVPLLPKERIDPMGQGDLPQELADMIRPFRRRAALTPVAALRCERREFALRDDHGVTMALVRDDRVTVRRGGLTTARYREVMMTPIGPGLTEEQDFWLGQALGSAGATRVDRFLRLVNRLGAPANGLTDYPEPAAVDVSSPFGAFVTSLLSRRLRQILQADLALQADDPAAAGELGEAASLLRREIRSVAPALDNDWISDLDEELGWLALQASEVDALGTIGGNLKAKLRSERYLALLERLVSASRASRTGEARNRRAGEVLERMLDRDWRRLGKAAEGLRGEPPIGAWDDARAALDNLLRICDLLEEFEPGRFEELRPLLETTGELLTEAGRRASTVQSTRARAEEVTPLEAFELGRRYEHEVAEARAAWESFAAKWAKTAKKLGSPGAVGLVGSGSVRSGPAVTPGGQPATGVAKYRS